MKFYRPVCFLIPLLLALTACSPDDAPATADTPLALPSTVVKSENLPVEYTAVGNIVSDHRVDISSKIIGYIHSIEVTEGASIQQGQVLVTLDDSDVRAAIAQARSAVSSAKAQLSDADSDLKRYQNLLKDESVSETRVRKTRLLRDTLRDQLAAANAALDSAMALRQYTSIKSPVDGLVLTRHRRVGELASPGVPILSVESQQGLLFQTYLPERHLNLVKLDDTVVLKLDSLPESVKGKVLRIVASADPVTRGFKVDIFLPEELPGENTIIPGMFGRASFQLGSIRHPIIPTSAVFERGGLTGVFVLDSDKRAHFRWLRLGRQFSSNSEVISGLIEGERILLTAQADLPEGTLIGGDLVSANTSLKKASPGQKPIATNQTDTSKPLRK